MARKVSFSGKPKATFAKKTGRKKSARKKSRGGGGGASGSGGGKGSYTPGSIWDGT